MVGYPFIKRILVLYNKLYPKSKGYKTKTIPHNHDEKYLLNQNYFQILKISIAGFKWIGYPQIGYRILNCINKRSKKSLKKKKNFRRLI